MDTFDARRPAIPEPKPEQTIRAQPFYGGYIGKEINDFFAGLCSKYPMRKSSMLSLLAPNVMSW